MERRNPLAVARKSLIAKEVFKVMKIVFLAFAMLFLPFLAGGCASEGSSAPSGTAVYVPSADGSEESGGGEGGGEAENTPKYITFRLSVNGEIEGNVYYCFLFNAEGKPIQVDDVGTLTDAIRVYNGGGLESPTCIWFRRINPADRILSYMSELTNYVSYTDDKSSVLVTFPLGDTSVIFNNYIQSSFTAQALVCSRERDSELGKFIDCIGPDLSSSTHYSVMANPSTGALGASLPAGYPSDCPYENCDITSFSIEVS